MSVASAGNVGDTIVDNTDEGFSSSAGWKKSGVTNVFGETALSTFSSAASASWTPNLVNPGNYEVFVWLSRTIRGGNTISRAQSVEYAIEHGGMTTTVVVDQNSAESGNWTLLGSFGFDAMGNESVSLLPGSAGYEFGSVGVDAVRFSPNSSGLSVDLTVDNLDAGFAVSGSWSESGALDEFNGSSVYSTNANDIAKWSFPGGESGTYQVFVWISAALPGGRAIVRNDRARYLVQSADSELLVVMDQNKQTGEWRSLGEFIFSGFSGIGDEGVSVFSSGNSTVADAVRFVKTD